MSFLTEVNTPQVYNYSTHINTIKNTNATYIVLIVHLQCTKIVELLIQCKPILKFTNI